MLRRLLNRPGTERIKDGGIEKAGPVDMAEILLCTTSCCFHSSISHLGFDLSTGRVVPLYVRTPNHDPALVEYGKMDRVGWSPEPGDLETELHVSRCAFTFIVPSGDLRGVQL